MQKDERAIIASQNEFVLTNDITPIAIRRLGIDGCSFKGPLPLGTRKFFESEKISASEFRNSVSGIVMSINKEIASEKPPFQNIFLGYHDRSLGDRKHLLGLFAISDALIDDRGVYAVEIGSRENAIYLNSGDCDWKISDIAALSHLFEPDLCWECKHLDAYWQALLAREFAVRYFNLLNLPICVARQENKQKKLI